MKIELNISKYDPFYRGWLLSGELFYTLQENAPRFGCNTCSNLHGGDAFECEFGSSSCVRIWVAPRAILVAYVSTYERYGLIDSCAGLHEFEGWIKSLREAEPLELGQVRDSCSYGAIIIPGHPLPLVKWAQWGDWSALARSWFADGRALAPWP